MSLVFKYVLLALIATVVNLSAQEFCLHFVAGFAYQIYLSMIFGTGVGLLVKYWLDKRYIFFYVSKNVADSGRTFLLYSLMGVVTTLIFWCTELTFEWCFHTKIMRYCGGALGLSVGYYLKYQLDKRFVFKLPTANGFV